MRMPEQPHAGYPDRQREPRSARPFPGDFGDDFGVALADGEDQPNSAAMDPDDLVERYSLLGTSLRVLERRIRERAGHSRSHRELLGTSLKTVTFDLEEHLRVWREVETNPAAADRRTFLQSQAIRLREELGRASLEEVDRCMEIERERDRLLLEYVQLRRVVEALR
jgi:hypothetical protein